MTKAIKFSAIIALFFATSGVMGSEPKITVDELRKNIVIQLDEPAFNYRIRFSDKENNVIFSDRIHKDEIRDKILDLTKLPIGDYLLTVENLLQTANYEITVENSGVTMVTKKIDHKPVYRKKDEKVYLNLLNLELSSVNIEVRDAMDRMLFSETIDGALKITKVFNFEKAYVGSYTIKVKDGTNVYIEEINVK